MLDLLFLVFVFPLAGFLILAFARGRLAETPAAIVGVGSIGLSALTTLLVGWQFLANPPPDHAHTQVLWTWMSVGQFGVDFALRLDALSLTMLGVITGVGFFIHLFASWYMRGDDGYDRFFSYMNLFVASMIFLVLGDNLLFLYFGWEGVGLCSYLLIGFWYKDPANGAAARKAFVVTRVGDTFMAIGLFILWHELGTLNIQELLVKAPQAWAVGKEWTDISTIAALLLLGGAVGKSAQLPLQTWLPDAMAGPTPVSALIHAATMVTAGVYLIARTHVLFDLAPLALACVGWVGAITALMAGFAGLAQTDIKRVLAYSTMSQIGYMFLALGAGAWTAGIFHLMTHAFFKALLFLSAGSIILALHHEQDIFRMGGLRKQLPFVFWVFLIGCIALIALPPTSGFFSKDAILLQALNNGHAGLFYAGLFGAFMTALYTFRMVFIVFFGESQAKDVHVPHGADHTLPLAVLAVAAVLGGFIPLNLESVLPQPADAHPPNAVTIAIVSVAVSLAGVALAWLLFGRDRALAERLARRNAAGDALRRLWLNAWGFDWLYDKLFVQPYLWFTRVNAKDGVDVAIGLIPTSLRAMHHSLARTQTGRIRWYAAAIAGGAVLVLGTALV